MKINFVVLLVFLTHLFSYSAWAQTVSNVKDKKAIVDLGGESWGPGDKIFALDAQGKKKALMQIRQVKNGRAVVEILKGNATIGMTVAVARKGSGTASKASGGNVVRGLRAGSAYGFTGALMMNTMKISNLLGSSFEMTGTNFGGGMFYDYPLTRSWFARGHGTIEMFDVKKKVASPVCDGGASTDCNVSFMQAGFYGTFNYIFTPSPMRWWAGAGGGALIYLSKKSSALNTSALFFNTVLVATGGFDYFLSRNTFLPVSFEYQMIPDKEAGVTSMVLRAGWGTTF